jgi:hypothetical protein
VVDLLQPKLLNQLKQPLNKKPKKEEPVEEEEADADMGGLFGDDDF